MIELSLALALAAGAFGFGIIGGILLHYFIEHKPLRADYKELIGTLTYMKRQGFVPQFDIKQPKIIDPADNVDEF